MICYCKEWVYCVKEAWRCVDHLTNIIFNFKQEIKTKYNDLAEVLAQCNKDGFQLAKLIEDSTYRDCFTTDIVDLHKKWADIGRFPVFSLLY